MLRDFEASTLGCRTANTGSRRPRTIVTAAVGTVSRTRPVTSPRFAVTVLSDSSGLCYSHHPVCRIP